MKAKPFPWVTPSAYNMSLSEGSYSLLDISTAWKKASTLSSYTSQYINLPKAENENSANKTITIYIMIDSQ